jgi:hypothetical protein
MSGIKDQEKIDELRRRLYERGNPDLHRESHPLTDTKEDVPEKWEQPPQPIVASPSAVRAVEKALQEQDMAPRKIQRNYRLKILMAGFGFFVLAMAISSLFLVFGRNNISAGNITIAATGPFTIGGGEELQMQVGITNGNTVAIESATLIVEYPDGTLSADEENKELFTERLSLETIGQGETINVPMRARVFGEENQEKLVKVSIEYRVRGSNATFFKEAEPLRFKISSSPIIVRADTLKKISSGQETEVKLTIISNSPSTLSEILIKAEYPVGFDFTKSSPAPEYGKNMWLIEDLEPETEQTVTITGVVVGKETDEYAINFSVGVPNERDQQSLASIFATAQTQFEIERPFLDIELEVEGASEGEAVIKPKERAYAVVNLKNVLDDTLYDIEVEVKLSGNAFSIYELSPSTGYFDASQNTITWDVSNTPALRQATPGDSKRVAFSVEPSGTVSRTPQINVNVNVKARRVSESQVAEYLEGTASSIIKVVSEPSIRSVVSHGSDIFVDSGPVPPVVGRATTYTVSMLIENGSNEITDAIVSTSLPGYVTWLDKTAGTGKLDYNPTTRAIEWSAGDVAANGEVYASFQVSLVPSQLQLGTTPTLVGEQRVKAIDRFTGTIVRDTHPAVTTQTEGGETGTVRASDDD